MGPQKLAASPDSNDPHPIRTRRWSDPSEVGDGLRLLVCRYRPRALRKESETWDRWIANLGPSRALHADYYGKNGPPIGWPEFRPRYLAEMRERRSLIEELGLRVSGGERLTLLCSSHCLDAALCHRTLLRALVLEQARTLRVPRGA